MTNKNQITIDDLIQGFEALRSEAFTRESLITEQKEEINELKEECGELKAERDLYKTWYRAKHGDIKNLLGSYRKALEEIEGEAMSLKCFNFNYYELGIGEDIVEYAKQILDIINKAKGE